MTSSPTQPLSIKSPRLKAPEPPDEAGNGNGKGASAAGAGAGMSAGTGLGGIAGAVGAPVGRASLAGTPLSGTPDLRALRAQYGGTPPLPNIPLPRSNAAVLSGSGPGPGPVSASASASGVSLAGTSVAAGSAVAAMSPLSSSPGRGLRPLAVGGITAAAREAALAASSSSSVQAPNGGNNLNVTNNNSGSGTTTPALLDLDDLPEEEKLRVLRRHLVSKHERQQNNNSNNGEAKSVTPSSSDNGSKQGAHSRRGSSIGPGREDSELFPIPYHAPGADVTHDIYKWHADQRRAGRVRSASFAGPSQSPDPAFEHIHEPGGFRRNFVLLRANEQGVDEPRVLNNFIDFLLLFGHFAGEDLEEEEEEKEGDLEENIPEAAAEVAAAMEAQEAAETTPLISRSRSRSRRRRLSVSPRGNATVTQAVLMLLKSFVGTGVLFLGKAFYNGGILFSSVLFVFIAMISLYSFLLLVNTKFVVSGSFGDIGGTLYGPWMRYTILGSIVLSQLGFVCAYTIFVAQNLQAFVMGITHCIKLISVPYFILMQLVVFLPLALVRNLAKLSSTALVADAFILAGLLYIFGSEINILSTRGVADVKLFNPKDFPLFVGTAVFSFEGIGLVIPITDAMREPHKFPAVLTGVMAFLTVLFGGAGVLAYLTFGSEIQTVVLVNLDSDSKMVQSVQFLYSLAILLSVPLQLFPAVRILENGLFTRSGKADVRVKWLKNVFRFAMVMLCTVISWWGAADLDKFVAFIGSAACVPLCYVYPAMLHYKACARTRRRKVADIVMIIFGLAAAAYTSVQTVRLMLEPDHSGAPKLGNCEPPH